MVVDKIYKHWWDTITKEGIILRDWFLQTLMKMLHCLKLSIMMNQYWLIKSMKCKSKHQDSINPFSISITIDTWLPKTFIEMMSLFLMRSPWLMLGNFGMVNLVITTAWDGHTINSKLWQWPIVEISSG